MRTISESLATIILVAITSMAAIALAGFIFGLFGDFTSPKAVYVCHSQGLTTYIVSAAHTQTIQPTNDTVITTTGYGCP